MERDENGMGRGGIEDGKRMGEMAGDGSVSGSVIGRECKGKGREGMGKMLHRRVVY